MTLFATAPHDGTSYTIRLERDVSPAESELTSDLRLFVKNGQNIVLDLNGHSLDRGLKEGVSHGNIFSVSGGSLTITGSGTIRGGYPDTTANAHDGSAATVSGGSLTLAGGTLSGNRNGRGVVSVTQNGSFTMSGGEIVGNSAYASGYGVSSSYGSVALKGGSIRNTTIAVLSSGSNTSISVSGAPALTGNRQGVYLRDGVIQVTDRLSENVRIGVTHTGTPTADAPLLLTSGLADRGSAANFVSDSSSRAIGLNADGEAVLGLPSTLSFDANGGSGTMADLIAAKGG